MNDDYHIDIRREHVVGSCALCRDHAANVVTVSSDVCMDWLAVNELDICMM